MDEFKKEIAEHYDINPRKEWDRLKKDHPFEFRITTRMMERYIKPEDSILDIGGGPGRYSIHYAKKGHQVTLFDLSKENVAFAKKMARNHHVKMKYEVGDACDLSRFQDSAFDQVFLMGPLYHLLNLDDRKKAVSEAIRVLKPGGHLFASFISIFGGFIFVMKNDPRLVFLTEDIPFYEHFFKNESFGGKGFTYAFFTTKKDVFDLFSLFKDELLYVTFFGQESILAPNEFEMLKTTKAAREQFIEYAYRLCENPDYYHMSEHFMFIGKKI